MLQPIIIQDASKGKLTFSASQEEMDKESSLRSSIKAGFIEKLRKENQVIIMTKFHVVIIKSVIIMIINTIMILQAHKFVIIG